MGCDREKSQLGGRCGCTQRNFRALHSGNYTREIVCVWAFPLVELNGEDLRHIRSWRDNESSS